MRISDWSSDVCSSDLRRVVAELLLAIGIRCEGPALGEWCIARDVATCVMLLGESRIQPGACAANRGLGLPGVYGRQDLSAPDRLALVETCRTDRTRRAGDEFFPALGFAGASSRGALIG